MRPKSKDMKPGTVLRHTRTDTRYILAQHLSDGWSVTPLNGWRSYEFTDYYIDHSDQLEVVSVPDEPDTPAPAPYPLAEGEVLAASAREVAELGGWEWRDLPVDYLLRSGWADQPPITDRPCIARPKPPRTVPVLLPEDVVREAVEDSWFKNFLAAGRDPNLIDDACREALTKLETPMPEPTHVVIPREALEPKGIYNAAWGSGWKLSWNEAEAISRAVLDQAQEVEEYAPNRWWPPIKSGEVDR